MPGLSELHLSLGLTFQRSVLDCFSTLVSFLASPFSHEFWLVCSFGRSSICLNEDSIRWILQSVLRGLHKDYKVFHLSGWMFHFSIFSKDVGFLVYRLHKFICDSFTILFSLWGSGGPNWEREFLIRDTEEEVNWTTVSRSHKKKTEKKTSAQVSKMVPK